MIRLTDTLDLVKAETVKSGSEFVDNAPGIMGASNVLRLTIDASHAGIRTRNNAMYLPSEMKKGAQGFNKGYKKPFLVHHDKYSDPIGRIVKGIYIDVSGVVSSKFTDAVPISILRQINDASVAPKYLPLVQKLLDSKVLDDPDWMGLGYLQIDVAITDKAAQEKFLDGRYQTVSVGLSAATAICSIEDCWKNWADGGPCDHSPGKTYEGKRATLLVGGIRYDEVSAVSVPADPFASVVEIIQDETGRTSSVGYESFTDFYPKTSTAYELLTVEDNSVVPPAKEVSKSKTLVEEAFEAETLTEKQVLIQAHDRLHSDWDWRLREGGLQSAEKPSEATYKLHAKLHREALDNNYRDEFVNGIMDQTLPDYGVSDDPYTAEDKVEPKAFVSVLADIALLGPKDEVAYNGLLDTFSGKDYTDFENSEFQRRINKKVQVYGYQRRTQELMDKETENKIAELEGTIAGLRVNLLEKETQVKDLEDSVIVLRNENRVSSVDIKALEDQNTKLSVSLTDTKAELASVLSVLTEKDFKPADETEALFSAMDSVNLDVALEKYRETIGDLSTVHSKIFGDAVPGIANAEPVGEVKVDDQAQNTETPEQKATESRKADIKTHYLETCATKGQIAGRQYLERLSQFKLLKDFTQEEIFDMLNVK